MKREYQIKRIRAGRDTYKVLLSIAKIWDKSFGDQGDYYPKTIRELIDFFISRKYSFFVLYRNDVIVASCMEDMFNGSYGITNVCVLEKLKGYGSMLLKYIKCYHDSIDLEVWEWEGYDDPVYKFYLKNGFKVVNDTNDKDKYGEHVNEDVIRVIHMRWTK